MKDSEVHYRQELMQTLSIRDLVVYGMLYMLPIAPFGMFGLLAKPTHGLVPLAYCLSFIAVIFTARSYMIFSNAFPVAGSVYTYTRIGINDLAGFFGGWVVFLDYVLAPGLMAVVSAAAMNDLLPLVPRWGWILIFLGLGTGMNLVGVNLTAKANRWMLAAMLVVLAVFLWVGLHALYFEGKGDGGLTFRSFYDPHLFTWPVNGVRRPNRRDQLSWLRRHKHPGRGSQGGPEAADRARRAAHPGSHLRHIRAAGLGRRGPCAESRRPFVRQRVLRHRPLRRRPRPCRPWPQ